MKNSTFPISEADKRHSISNAMLPGGWLWCGAACDGNPGPGGWAAVLFHANGMREIAGGVQVTTSNTMELQAVTQALRALEEPHDVILYTDSRYVNNGISKCLKGWKARGWRTKARKSIKNKELWEALDAEAAKHRITCNADDDAMHDICNSLAKSEIVKVRRQFNSDELKKRLDEFRQSVKDGSPLSDYARTLVTRRCIDHILYFAR
jgi:ribonuclease HI